MWRIWSEKKGEVSLLVVLGLIVFMGASAYLTTALNQTKQTTQTRASGNCGDRSKWISDCEGYNPDQKNQCSGWFDAECGGSNNDNNDDEEDQEDPTPTPNSGGGGGGNCGNKSGWISDCLRYNGSDKTAQCTDWYNAECPPTPTPGAPTTGANPTIPSGGAAGSCNNGQIPNGSWACDSSTSVIQCKDGVYINKTNCTRCTGISPDKGSICQGGANTPTPTPRNPNCPPAMPHRCPGSNVCVPTFLECDNTRTPTIPARSCSSPDVWCVTTGGCRSISDCPTPTAIPTLPPPAGAAPQINSTPAPTIRRLPTSATPPARSATPAPTIFQVDQPLPTIGMASPIGASTIITIPESTTFISCLCTTLDIYHKPIVPPGCTSCVSSIN